MRVRVVEAHAAALLRDDTHVELLNNDDRKSSGVDSLPTSPPSPGVGPSVSPSPLLSQTQQMFLVPSRPTVPPLLSQDGERPHLRIDVRLFPCITRSSLPSLLLSSSSPTVSSPATMLCLVR